MIEGLKINQDFVFSKLDKQSIIFNSVSGKYYVVNDVGSFIIDRLYSNNFLSVSDLYEALLIEFNVSKDQAIKETDKFLNKLIDYGYLKRN